MTDQQRAVALQGLHSLFTTQLCAPTTDTPALHTTPTSLPPLAVTPPGFYTANGVTQQCPDASFRSGWKKGDAESCTPCGQGVLAEKTDRLTVFDPITYQPSLVNITTDSEDCCEFDTAGVWVVLCVPSGLRCST